VEAAGASVELEAGTRLDSITDPRSAARRARGLPEMAANQTQTSDRAAGKTVDDLLHFNRLKSQKQHRNFRSIPPN